MPERCPALVRKRLPRPRCVPVLLAWAALAVPWEGGGGARGAEWFVDASACPGPGSGSAADPFCSVQAGVDVAAPGDRVRVAAGRYEGTGVRPVDIAGFVETLEAVLFLKDGIEVAGAGVAATVLDAGGAAGVVVADRCGAATLLSGMTLEGAARGATGSGPGAGLFVNQGSPVIRDLEVQGAEGGTAGVDLLGPGAPVLERVAVRDGGQTRPLGAAMAVTGAAAARLEGCVVRGNRGLEAGGILVADSTISLVNAVVAWNQGIDGGGVRVVRSPGSDLLFSTVTANTADAAGAGVRLESSTVLLRGSIVAANRALGGAVGGVFVDAASALAADHNDVHGNLEADWQSRLDPTGSAGNIAADPRFRDLSAADFRLREGSPAIDAAGSQTPAGDARAARRPLDGDRDGAAASDMGAFEYDRFQVRGVRAGGPGFRLTWEPQPEAGGYRVQRGDLSVLASGDYGACMTSGGDLAEPLFEDGDVPPPGSGFFYLVASRVEGVDGTLGFDSRGLERLQATGAGCP